MPYAVDDAARIAALRAVVAQRSTCRQRPALRHSPTAGRDVRRDSHIDGPSLADRIKDLLACARDCDPNRRGLHGFHDVRHAHASHFLESQAPRKGVSKRLSHSSIALTLGRYRHLLPAMHAEAAAVVDSLLAGFRSAKCSRSPAGRLSRHCRLLETMEPRVGLGRLADSETKGDKGDSIQ